jgi:hypothetical protein
MGARRRAGGGLVGVPGGVGVDPERGPLPHDAARDPEQPLVALELGQRLHLDLAGADDPRHGRHGAGLEHAARGDDRAVARPRPEHGPEDGASAHAEAPAGEVEQRQLQSTEGGMTVAREIRQLGRERFGHGSDAREAAAVEPRQQLALERGLDALNGLARDVVAWAALAPADETVVVERGEQQVAGELPLGQRVLDGDPHGNLDDAQLEPDDPHGFPSSQAVMSATSRSTSSSCTLCVSSG